MTDVLKELSEASWRGIKFPFVSRTWEFMHEHARHRLLYQNRQLIEALGGQNPPYQYTIPFRENLRFGEYRNLFTVVYPQFLRACTDASDGLLDDPIHGPIQVKCATIRELVDSDRRDGIDVEVGFIESPDEDFDREDLASNLESIEGARDVAGSFDDDIEKIDWQQEQPPEATQGLFDTISSVANQLEVAANKPFAALDDQIYRFKRAEESIARLADPRAEPARQKARRIRLALLDQRNGLAGSLLRSVTGGSRARVRTHIVQADIGTISLAARLSMDVDRFLQMNPQIRGQMTVSEGTQVFYLAS